MSLDPSCGSADAERVASLVFPAEASANPNRRVLEHVGMQCRFFPERGVGCLLIDRYTGFCHEPYLGPDYEPEKCNATVRLYSVCASAEFCGTRAGRCQTVHNGLDAQVVLRINQGDRVQLLSAQALALVYSALSDGRMDDQSAQTTSLEVIEAARGGDAARLGRIVQTLSN